MVPERFPVGPLHPGLVRSLFPSPLRQLLSSQRALGVGILVLLSMLAVWSPIVEAQSTTGPLDLVLIVDTSKTMVGAGGNANIFSDVQDACRSFISKLKTGDTVTLIPFASTARVQPTVTIASDTERERLYNKIYALKADGNWTYTAEALSQGLREAERLEGLFSGHNQLVLILTDGLNDPPPGARAKSPTLQSVTEPYAGKPWYVYQVQLGPNVDPKLQSALKVFPNGKTIHDPRAQDLGTLRRKIVREIKPKEPKKPEEVRLSLGVKKIQLTLKEPAKRVEAAQEIRLPAKIPAAAVTVTVSDRGDISADIDLATEIISEAGEKPQLRVTATAAKELKNGECSGRLRMGLDPAVAGVTAVPVEIPLSIKVRMQPPLWPKLLLGILGAIVLLGILFALVRTLQGRKMAGQLEYWPEGNPKQRTKIADLSVLGARATIGSDAIPLSPDAGELGTLVTRKVDGERHVVVEAASDKKLTMNKKRLSELVLYDQDVFHLEGWEFHFRGAVGRRPR